MDGPLISVIVPVYQVEPYLRRCVDSIVSQTYENLEVLLIDDGSTDGSGAICDAYAGKDPRVKVIHKENGGLSDARNAGLDVMTGDYVTCIDSDDFVSERYVENLFTAIRKRDCDISASQFVEYYEADPLPAHNEVKPEEIEILSRREAYRRLLYQQGMETSAWGKLYRTSLFKNVRYPVGKLYEDIPVIYQLMEQTDSVAIIPQVDYCYFQGADSIARFGFDIRKLDGIYFMEELRQRITEEYPDLQRAAECRYFSCVCNILFLIKPGDGYDAERKMLWNEVKKYRRSVMMNKEGRKKARIAAALSYCGYRIMRTVYDVFE